MSVEALPSDASRDGLPPDEFSAQLTIPAATRFLRLARLTAAGLAGDLGFRVDSVEDLRVAVDELCAVIIDGTPPGTMLELTYREHQGGLVIEGSCPATDTTTPELHRVAHELLQIVADEYHVEVQSGCRRFRLLKHADSSGI